MENLKAPIEVLRYQKALLETMRQLTAIQQDLSTSVTELAVLINVSPGAEIPLEMPKELVLPNWDVPLEQMEEEAFLNNPDVREQGYLARIAVNDTRKEIVKRLPGITFTVERKNDYNSFLVDNHWYEAGTRLSWNLLNLFSAPAAIAYAKAGEELTKARRLALRMAVLAQIHIATRQFHGLADQFRQADALWTVDHRLAEIADARAAHDAQSLLERVATHASTLASRLRRFQVYAQAEQAFAKIQAALGRDLLPDTMPDETPDIDSLSTAIAARLQSWRDGTDVSVP